VRAIAVVLDVLSTIFVTAGAIATGFLLLWLAIWLFFIVLGVLRR
jgi:hypothetical protein